MTHTVLWSLGVGDKKSRVKSGRIPSNTIKKVERLCYGEIASQQG